MVTLEKVTLSPCVWLDEASEAFRSIFEPHHTHVIGEMKEDVKNGFSTLYEAEAKNERIGFIVMRFEIKPTGSKELVIVAAKMNLPGLNLSDHLLPEIEAFAKIKGASFVRFHTSREGFRRKASSNGYKPLETVYVKEL